MRIKHHHPTLSVELINMGVFVCGFPPIQPIQSFKSSIATKSTFIFFASDGDSACTGAMPSAIPITISPLTLFLK